MRKSSLFPRKIQGVDTRYPIGYNGVVAGNDTNEKGTTMRRPTHSQPKQPQDETTIRVPAKFFDDHEGRDCEPYCTVVKRTGRFVWLRPDDEGLDELLDDAKHYAEPGQFGEWGSENYGRGIVRSAAATVAAIQQSREAMVSK